MTAVLLFNLLLVGPAVALLRHPKRLLCVVGRHSWDQAGTGWIQGRICARCGKVTWL